MEWNVHILDQRGHAICFMAHSDGASPERDEANAALVAAAPDLLAALRAVRASNPLMGDTLGAMVDAAIAIATGQAPTGGAE